jgi:hypothetical protein
VSFASSHSNAEVFSKVCISDPGRDAKVEQVLWPDHCMRPLGSSATFHGFHVWNIGVQGTRGADIEDSVAESFKRWEEKGKGKRVVKVVLSHVVSSSGLF